MTGLSIQTRCLCNCVRQISDPCISADSRQVSFHIFSVHKITECVLCAVCVQMCVCVRDYACMPHVHVYGGDIKKTRTIRYTAIKFRSIKYRMVLSIVLNRDSFTTKIPFHFAIRTTTAFNTTFFFYLLSISFHIKEEKNQKI